MFLGNYSKEVLDLGFKELRVDIYLCIGLLVAHFYAGVGFGSFPCWGLKMCKEDISLFRGDAAEFSLKTLVFGLA